MRFAELTPGRIDSICGAGDATERRDRRVRARLRSAVVSYRPRARRGEPMARPDRQRLADVRRRDAPRRATRSSPDRSRSARRASRISSGRTRCAPATCCDCTVDVLEQRIATSNADARHRPLALALANQARRRCSTSKRRASSTSASRLERQRARVDDVARDARTPPPRSAPRAPAATRPAARRASARRPATAPSCGAHVSACGASTISTNSPRSRLASAANHAGASPSGMRAIVSNVLVSSRATTSVRDRTERRDADRRRSHATRCGASYKTSAHGSAASDASQRAARLCLRRQEIRRTRTRRRRAPPPTPRRSTAEGPGTGTTGNPASRTARTSRAPGSLIAGVPASLTSATLLPRAEQRRDRLARAAPRCAHAATACASRSRNAQQRRRHARVLGGDDVDRRQHVERAQRHVAQVTQRRGHHI